MREVTIYTDGACSGNPGPGGWAAVLLYRGARKEIAGGAKLTTNNRMEITAVITALETLKEPCAVTLFTDSRYVCDAVNKRWVYKWLADGWKRKSGPVPNSDKWTSLLALLERHDVTFSWVRGHADNAENERCDKLAREFITGGELEEDRGYASE